MLLKKTPPYIVECSIPITKNPNSALFSLNLCIVLTENADFETFPWHLRVLIFTMSVPLYTENTDQKSVNLQYITLGCLDDGTNESSTKSLIFQALFSFYTFYWLRTLKTLYSYFCNFVPSSKRPSVSYCKLTDFRIWRCLSSYLSALDFSNLLVRNVQLDFFPSLSRIFCL